MFVRFRVKSVETIHFGNGTKPVSVALFALSDFHRKAPCQHERWMLFGKIRDFFVE